MKRVVIAIAIVASACGGSSLTPGSQQGPTAADRDSALNELERRRAALGITQRDTDQRNGRYAFYPIGVGGVLLDTSTGAMWRVGIGDVATPITRYLSSDPNAGSPIDPKDPLGILR